MKNTTALASINDALGNFAMLAIAENDILGIEGATEVRITVTDGNSGSAAPVIEDAIERFGSLAYAMAISNLLNRTFLSAEECRRAVIWAFKGMLEGCGNSMSESARSILTTVVIALAR